MPLLVFELVNVCRKPVEGNLRLREQRDLYSRHNFEDVSNHISNAVFLLLTLGVICLLVLSVLYFNRFQIKMNSTFIHLQKRLWQIRIFPQNRMNILFPIISKNVAYVSRRVFHLTLVFFVSQEWFCWLLSLQHKNMKNTSDN